MKFKRFLSLLLAAIICFSLLGTASAASDGGDMADTAILYSDGTLVFQHGDTPDAAHGTVVGTYTGFNTAEYDDRNRTPWFSQVDKITSVDFADITAPISTSHWFYDCRNLESVSNAGNLNTSNVTNMSCMFDGCKDLTSLDVSSWDVSSVTDMLRMFSECWALTPLDVSSWDVSSVTRTEMMFYDNRKLTSIDVSEWDTAKLEYMSLMFSNCPELASIDVSGWNTSSALYVSYMFAGCSALTSLDFSSWDTGNVTTMQNMLGCPALEYLTLGENWKWIGTNHALRDVPWYNVATGEEYTRTTIPSYTAATFSIKPPELTVSASGDTATVPVELTTEAVVFSVTVPTSLPVSVAADGTVTVATDTKIVNHSHGMVEVQNLTVSGANGWSTIDYDNTNVGKLPVNSKSVALEVNGEKTTGADAMSFNKANWTPMHAYIDGSSEDALVLNYHALIPAQAVAVSGENIANIVFTVGWHTA